MNFFLFKTRDSYAFLSEGEKVDLLVSDVEKTDCYLEKDKSGCKPDSIYKNKLQMSQTAKHRESNQTSTRRKTW